MEPAQKLLAVDTLIRFPLLLISAANHLIFGFGSLLETGAQCKRAKLIIKEKKALRLQQGRKSNYKEKECRDGEPELPQTGVLKGFMSLSFSRL